MEHVEPYFIESDAQTLALFDIDMVLIQPKEPAFQYYNIEKHKQVAKKILFSMSPDEMQIFFNLSSTLFGSVLVNQKTPDFLCSLKENGVAMLGLTASLTGQVAGESCLERKKVELLKEHGIVFSSQSEAVIFSDLPRYLGNPPLFTDGILFSNGLACSKGDLLVAYLKRANRAPKKIIFLDDIEKNLQSVEDALAEYDPSIEFIGLHFVEALQSCDVEMEEEEFRFKWMALREKAIEVHAKHEKNS